MKKKRNLTLIIGAVLTAFMLLFLLIGFFYICDYLNITPQEFFNADATAPQKSKELLREIERLTPEQTDHIMLVVRDLIKTK